MYERLTKRNSNGDVASHVDPKKRYMLFVNRLAAYEDSGLSPQEVQKMARAKAEGRLVVLLCKVGDTVYVIIDSVDIPYVRQEKVIAIEFWNKNGAITLFIRTPYGLFEFGKTVFLTREAAEKAIAEAGK